jgi:hypothetical protein
MWPLALDILVAMVIKLVAHRLSGLVVVELVDTQVLAELDEEREVMEMLELVALVVVEQHLFLKVFMSVALVVV